ncbi:ComF family protein [Amaricoccus solimangrovi]|uniref:ComF family protein n=1 Tax=Amaricoccus solimangrovi TaxID=2589815 RepID=A0A501X0H5_9RHOB|nr:ComF family protein [Amaricoccus solimangrovi]TPE52236.1 ComF family protein [Amaricoccus solimangrovi]
MLQRLKSTVIGPLVDTLYPPRCLACGEMTEGERGLCAACWRDTHFISGEACVKCGLPLVGEASGLMDDAAAVIDGADVCDPCRRHPPGWNAGAAAVLYGGAARRVVLAFKHGDRLDMRDTLAEWMLPAGGRLLARADLIAPVPLHWRRLLRRRYNQSAELARALARRAERPVAVDLLTRRRFTTPQEGMDREARARNQAGAFAVAPRHRPRIEGRSILLIDDVLTSGATLSACAGALREGGAARVDVLVLARVAFAEFGSI